MNRITWTIVVALLAVGACADRRDGAADSTETAIMDGVQDGMSRVDESLDGADVPVADDGLATEPSLLDLNLASAEQLRALGLPDAAVQAISEDRPFANMVEVDEVLLEVLDGEAREAVYRQVWIPLDLNSASREEILLIPGVGSRMAHEFEEYRPYTAMAQFRREIGKYVDDAEVDRLAMYVRVD